VLETRLDCQAKVLTDSSEATCSQSQKELDTSALRFNAPKSPPSLFTLIRVLVPQLRNTEQVSVGRP